jgi:hypothetical protein
MKKCTHCVQNPWKQTINLPEAAEIENNRVDCSVDLDTLSHGELLEEKRKIEEELADLRAADMLARAKQSSDCCGSRPKRTSSGLP